MNALVSNSDQERARRLTEQANELRRSWRWEEALPLCFAAAKADPFSPAAAFNLGVMLSKMGRLDEADAELRRAADLAPGLPVVIHALAHNLLAQGRFKEAWPLYDVRASIPELNTGFPTNFNFPRWSGEPLAGKRLAVFPEQGLGDQIQFSRFLPQLIRRAESVTILALPPLERLFRHNFPGAEIVLASGKVEFPDPHFWTTMHDLPAALRIGLEDIPTAPYIRAPVSWPPLGEGFKVGVKPNGNSRFINDAMRSLPAEAVERLRAGLPGHVIDLEPDASGARDLADTAAIIDQLDLVISVDTSVSHLAGAMGKPCMVLLPGFGPDWRWMHNRRDSPWYPGHRLYRSGFDNDWGPPIDQVLRDAHAYAAPARTLGREAVRLRDRGLYAESLAAGRRSLAIAPSDPVVLHNHARLLTDLGQLEEGEKFQRRAVAAGPGTPLHLYGLGLNLLAQGKYAEGWKLYAERAAIPTLNAGFPQNIDLPRWQGDPIAGQRIAIFPEQGFGDQLQFARFLPKLRALGAEVVLFVPPALVRLLKASFPEILVIEASGTASFPHCSTWTTLVDLARLLGARIENLPPADYLPLPPPLARKGFRVGIMTRGNPALHHDAHRSLPSEACALLRQMMPGDLVELDPEISGARDFLDTAHIIADLDLVVSIDTSVGHLAGVCGKPCALLINGFATDWRWLRGRSDSPWYPKHRLFRGGVDGNWDAAIAELLAHVESFAAALPS
jgi:tetratricopeptide (TPR) repeat protein